MESKNQLKWAVCNFGEEIKTQNFKFDDINEVILQTFFLD